MAKIDRLERLDGQRLELEALYRATLIAALRQTAGGEWGLFGHNEGRHSAIKMPAVVGELADLAATIDTMRERLALESFALHAEFMAARGQVSAHAVGEPRQAKAWLDRLEAD